MAKIDDLLAHVTDNNLRRELSAALAELRRHRKFGLVSETASGYHSALPLGKQRSLVWVDLLSRSGNAMVAFVGKPQLI